MEIMDKKYKEFLFTKHILVNEGTTGADQVPTIYALRNLLNIRVTDGFYLAHPSMISFAEEMLGENIPDPFYRGFPQSVRELTPNQLLLDQLIHYTKTYGFGDFEEAGHSLFETVLERSDFDEDDEPKEFRIMTWAEAIEYLRKIFEEALQSTRPLNTEMMYFIVSFINDKDWMPKKVASKQNAIDLLLETNNFKFVRFLQLPDVVRLVDTINWRHHGSEKINKLHLTNKERKLVTRVLDMLLSYSVDLSVVQTCIEKRDVWKGILHHIHYCPKNDNAKATIAAIYNDDIRSAYAAFEKGMSRSTMDRAFLAKYLKDSKGNAALLRNLNYILQSAQDVDEVLDIVDAKSPLVIMQMQNMYRNYNEELRNFKFTRHERIRSHQETFRKNYLDKDIRDKAVSSLENKLKAALAGKVGKVYIAPGMEKIAVPVNLSAGESGFGIMPTGSRIALPEGKKIRAFTYWEKVNDIDLACFGIDKDWRRYEFSWRTMYGNQSDAITYSGDETSGYHGGSEYFDIDFDKVREMYPNMKYMVFTDNVYSGISFVKCVCRAGWMSRDVEDSGEIYEPKTVKSAYTINAKTTFCYLYAIDIEKREVIWLNVADAQNRCVAGTGEFRWLYDYFTLCETMNMRKLFEYAATEVIETPDEADLVVGDIETDKEQIRSYEFEKVFAYLS